jgi:hypothetical protein
MPADNSHIPPSRTIGVGVPASRHPAREAGQARVEIPRRRPRRRTDPYDLGAAITRLAQLLAFDVKGPRIDVPRGFYLDILV